MVRARRSSHDLAVDQQVDACLAGEVCAADQHRDEIVLNLKRWGNHLRRVIVQ